VLVIEESAAVGGPDKFSERGEAGPTVSAWAGIMKKQNPEGLLTASIRHLLKSMGVFHWKNFGGFMGAKGVPDILGCYHGKLLGIEVKAPNGKVSPDQQIFIENINRAGGLAFVARSVDDVIEGLGLQDRFLLR
jgi:hypothetical protein